MKVIGLTGSIAMGKSEVAKIFRAAAIPVFDADAEVHALYDSPEGAALLQPLAPEAISEGKVSRAKLSALVMADKTLLERLEPVVHDAVARRRAEFLRNAEAAGHSLAVVDVPLLFEKGYDKDVDVTLVVSAPEALQRKRALARPNMTEDRLGMILARQMPDAEKRRRADIVIENDGSLEDLLCRVHGVIEDLRRTTS